MKAFKSRKAVWLGIGGAVVFLGLFAYALLMPNIGKPYGGDAPRLQVPSMRNAPDNAASEKLELETVDQSNQR